MDDSAGGDVTNTSNVVFNNILSNQTLDIDYDTATGEFTLNTAGIYYISWWIAEDVAIAPVSFSVTLNNAPGPVSFSPLTTGQVSGSAIVTIGATATVTLTNQTGSTVTYSTTAVQGGMTIIEVQP